MLKINMEYRRGILFIRLRGNLSVNTVSKFEEYTIPIIKNYGIRYVVYNLNNIANLDDEGISSINRSVKLIKKNRGKALIVSKKDSDTFNNLSISNELVALELLNT
ncbi:MAG: STAS domain-containing protein [Bacilli bacterium]|nr:STAS domain-containing protein [Bacilli bacterium]